MSYRKTLFETFCEKHHMKKIISLLLALSFVLLLAGCGYSTEYDSKYDTKLIVQWWVVNVRKGPGTNYGIITQVCHRSCIEGTGNISRNANDPDNPIWIEVHIPGDSNHQFGWITREAFLEGTS